jgi:CoA:oxalate CoA-transferase
MGDIPQLAELLGCTALLSFTVRPEWFARRDEIKAILAEHLLTHTTEHWLSVLEPADIWCAGVMDYDALVKEKGYTELKMEIVVKTSNGLSLTTTRCPISVDGKMLTSEKGAPLLGEHNAQLNEQFGLLKKKIAGYI